VKLLPLPPLRHKRLDFFPEDLALQRLAFTVGGGNKMRDPASVRLLRTPVFVE
jgi:hypothetical protein